jgi:WD40 repeat protein/energy-coupling factor transporter ATP-binding protein EcfA2
MFEGNPFPGLRPFEFDENYLFFGREEQVTQLLQRLGSTRFLAVVGASGSGKSSLVRAGLLPELHGGTMTSTSIAWEISIMRPGGDPLTKLAQALVESNLFGDVNEENVLQTRATLSRSGLGLIEAYRQSDIEEGSNLLLLVDQFEEIFRFRQSGDKTGQEASHFIQLLLETARQTEFPIFIILTMRSDFLGDCAEFKGLAEAVNEGEYLIPRLNRKQRARAIEGPVKVGGAEISPRLKQQLLNDIGDDPDQLPILQHALMRMWDYWLNNANREQALDLDHYNGIGRMTEALSRHGDEVYEELPDDNHRLLCMKLFKAITEKQGDGRGVRRPLPFSEIDEITGHQRKKMLTVIDAYRPIGRTFIMPGENVKIHDKIIIDISHESLMRVWQRLKNWVNDEADSARIYIRLCETAQLHNRGEAGFYRDPDLKIALAWRDNNKPNANWGTRINDSFELAMRFLDDSSEDFEAEQKAKEEARKRELEQAKALAKAERERAEIQRKSAKRNKVFAVFLFALAVLAGVLAYQANKAEKQAVASEQEAQDNLSFSHHRRSDLMMQQHLSGQSLARMGYRYRQHSEYSIIPEKVANHLNHHPFMRQSRTIYHNQEDVVLYTGLASQISADNRRSFFLHNESGKSYMKVVDLREGKSVSQSENLKSVEALISSQDGKRGFVVATGLEEKVSGGFVIDADNGETIEIFLGANAEQRVTAISGKSDLSRVLVGRQDGRLMIYDLTGEKKVVYEEELKFKIGRIEVSPDQSNAIAVTLEDESIATIYQIDLNLLKSKKCFSTRRDKIHSRPRLKYSPRGTYFSFLAGDFGYGHVSVYRAVDGSQIWMNDTSHFRFSLSAAFSHDETILATPSIDTTVRLWDVESGLETSLPLRHDGGVWRAVFSPDQKKLAVISDQNDLWIWSIPNESHAQVLYFPRRLKAEIVDVAFNQTGDKLVTITIDGEFLEWDLNVPTFKPMLLTHSGGIQGYDLSQDGKWAATGGEDNVVSLWDMENKRKYNQIVLDNSVGMVEFQKDGSRLFVVEKAGLIPIHWSTYSLPDLSKENEGSMPREDTSNVAFAPDGQHLVYSRDNNDVTLVRVNDNKSTSLSGHGARAVGHSFSPDAQTVVTMCADNFIRAFDVSSGKEKYRRAYGCLWGSNVVFSNDGKLFVCFAQIGKEVITPVAFETATGKEVFRLKHGNGVSEVFFSPDGKFVYSGSRDFTAKKWDLSDTSKPIKTYFVGDWVSSQIVSPKHPDRLFVMSRGGDIYVYDTETALYIDGPYRGAEGMRFMQMKLKTKPDADYFLALNAPNVVAAWPFSMDDMKLENPQSLIDYSAALNGLEIDENQVLSVIKNSPEELKKREAALGGGKVLNRWKRWHMTGDEKSNPYQSMSAEQYRKFLISQNTLSSLEAVLYRHPMDKEVLKIYATKLEQLSNNEELEKEKRRRFGVSAKWYKSLVK